jgi:hypothetical protein
MRSASVAFAAQGVGVARKEGFNAVGLTEL